MAGRDHEVQPRWSVRHQLTHQVGAGGPALLEPVQAQCRRAPAIARLQKRREMGHGSRLALGTGVDGYVLDRGGERVRQTGGERTRLVVVRRTVVANVAGVRAEKCRRLVEEDGAAESGGCRQHAEGEVVPQGEGFEEAIVLHKSAHRASVGAER